MWGHSRTPHSQKKIDLFTFKRFALDQVQIVGLLEDSALEATAQALQVAAVDVEHVSGHDVCGISGSQKGKKPRFFCTKNGILLGDDRTANFAAAAERFFLFSEKCHMTRAWAELQ